MRNSGRADHAGVHAYNLNNVFFQVYFIFFSWVMVDMANGLAQRPTIDMVDLRWFGITLPTTRIHAKNLRIFSYNYTHMQCPRGPRREDLSQKQL